MSMSSSIRLGVPPSTNLTELQASTSNRKARSSILTLPPSQINHKPIGGVSAQFPTLPRDSEASQKSQAQHLIDLLRDSAEKGYVEQAKAVHGFMLKSGFSGKTSMVMLNHVANAYSKCSSFGYARRLFEEMCQRNVFSWTVMIIGATENGYYLDGFNYFIEMLRDGVGPDAFACSAVVQTCIGLDSVQLGQMVHAQIVIRGYSSTSVVSTSLLNMYAKLARVVESFKIFNSTAKYNKVSWNAMISGLTSNGLHSEAYDNFLRMIDEGVEPNVSTFISVSKAVGQLGDAEKGREVERIASALNLPSDARLGTALIDMYSKCSSLDDARSLFDFNFLNSDSNTPWNAMLSGYSRCGCDEEALQLYLKMSQNNIGPDVYTFCSVLNAAAALKHLQCGKQVHGLCLKHREDVLVTSLSNAIADAYAKCGALEDVKRVFDAMEERDVISWTTLATAYSQHCEWEEALTIFSRMREQGFQPNQFIFSTVFASCAGICYLEFGQQVHALLFKSGYNTDYCVESALIDMYAKCGSIMDSEKVFKACREPDTVSWTAMIAGYAQHGMTKKALESFKEMELLGAKPNAITVLCVLLACSHGGMVEEGLSYFQLMEGYGLVPQQEHYACIVDLLGRVGQLDHAWDFIKKMPISPDEKVWLALLGSCRIHGNAELAQIASEKILSIRPEHSAAYILLSNTYQETGNVRDGLDLREVMEEQGVEKDPGHSWIFVDGTVHKFYSGDQLHPRKEDIYAKLDELRDKVKSIDYEPDLKLLQENLG